MLQKRLWFTWAHTHKHNSLTVIPGQEYNIAKLCRELELEIEKRGYLLSILGIGPGLLPPLLFMLLLNLSPPFSLSRLFFLNLLMVGMTSFTTLAAP